MGWAGRRQCRQRDGQERGRRAGRRAGDAPATVLPALRLGHEPARRRRTTGDGRGAGLGRLAEPVKVVPYEGEARPTLDQLAPLLGRADGLLSMTTDRVDAILLDTAPRLRVVSNAGVGTDNLDLPELTARGIPAGNTPGVLVVTTANLAFAPILAASRRIVEADRCVREGRWQERSFDLLLGQDMHGATLGIVGYGAIGRGGQARPRLRHDPDQVLSPR